jgi:heme A synthase
VSGSGEARARLLARVRDELPEPGDPRRLMDDLLAADAVGPEALQVLSRTSLAWMQLRDLRLERAWQGGYGWFLARNLMLLGAIVLLTTLALRPAFPLVAAALAGAGAYYLLVCLVAPLRLRRHARRRRAILQAYGADLGSYLDSLAG